MPSESWLESHGYRHIRCPSCGWSGTTDGGCENCSNEDECSVCEKHEDKCECWSCEHCDTKCPDGDSECTKCGEGRSYETLYRVKTHIARKDYHPSSPFMGIRKGDTYQRVVRGGYVVGKGRWLTVQRLRMKKGPGWDTAN